ncbi:MAG: putative sporulation protein YtxC [Firmicutes bacterium]|nr:putative sporulation protein YtxC [Bacillota bacterium]
MNPDISIGATKHIDLIKSNLNRQVQGMENNGMKLEVDELPLGKYTFLNFNVKKANSGYQNYQLFKNSVASVISDVILNKWENYIIYDIIRENYYYYNEDERNKIFKYAQEHVNNNEGITELDYKPVHQDRRAQIYQQLKEYLSNNDHLVVDGFIQFRLKDYVSFLREVTESAVDEFLMEREYDEFIQILRYFAEIQEPKVNEVHVVLKPDSTYKLYDENKDVINSDYLEEFIMTMNEEINYEDLVISALISISPKEIVFHHDKEKIPNNTIKTIKDVFIDKVNVCNGCQWCETEMKS